MFKKFIYVSLFVLLLGYVDASGKDLVAWWKLDGGAGTTAIDSTGNGYDGTVQGGASWTDGKFDGAMQFNGSDADIEAPHIPLDNRSFTITMWLNPTTLNGLNTILNQGERDDGLLLHIRIGGATGAMGQAPALGVRFAYWNNDLDTPTNIIEEGTWYHVACVYDYENRARSIYVDGVLQAEEESGVDPYIATTGNMFLGVEDADGNWFNGMMDDVRVYDTALSPEDILEVMEGAGPGSIMGLAKKPYPGNGSPSESIDIGEISWTPGEYVEAQGGTHNVFFGTDFNDVNDSTITELVGTTESNTQVADDNDYDPGILEYGTTYYWRVDEVNAIDTGEYKGRVWSFTVEDEFPKLPYQRITVTAIGSSSGLEPNDTVNEVGLDPNSDDMLEHFAGTGYWSSGKVDNNNVWIQYDFDNKYRLHEMLVWNYNQNPYLSRYGFKDVLIQYSEDGDTWTDMNDVNDVQVFNQASGDNGYKPNTTVSFNDMIIKSVRITAFHNWGDSAFTTDKLFGLSEVRFTYIPVRARKPSPDDNKADIAIGTTLKWRKGREAVTHKVYIDTDKAAVTNGTATAHSENMCSHSPTLKLARTYYWRVDEINSAMTPDVWEGNIWSFSTASSILVEGFETGYGNTSTDAVYLTWEDGGDPGSSANGSWMGRHTEPYLQTINHSGGHSSPMEFGRNGASDSWVTAQTVELPIGTSDWSIGSPLTLTIWFRGDPNNTETFIGDHQLYCTIGGKTATFGGSIDTLTRDVWRQWDIDLTSLGATLSNIPEITIGVKKVSGTNCEGVIYLDDIMLTGYTSLVASPDVFKEAEDYKTISSPMEVNDVVEGASGGQYIHAKERTTSSSNNPPDEGIATYEVDLSGGKYIIYGRVSIANANYDSFWVKVDGAESDQTLHTSGWCNWNAIPSGEPWHWDDIHSEADGNTPTVTWTIPAGTTTISIAYRDGNTNPPKLDALLFIKVGE